MALQLNYEFKIAGRNIFEDIEYMNQFLTQEQMQDIDNWLQNSYHTVTINDCYCRIMRLDGDKSKINISLMFYNNERTKTIIRKNYTFTPDLNIVDNLFKQAYLYLKTLPEYETAIDILEDGQN